MNIKIYLGGMLSVISLSACQHSQPLPEAVACLGTTALSDNRVADFIPIEDEALRKQALGHPEQGKLCAAQVYQARENSRITLYRAWNSTNPNSQFGQWWAWSKPTGAISAYRAQYDICYEWSPLDQLVECTLKAGIKIVVGTGQSAMCSPYVTYPVSATQQIFIPNAREATQDCVVRTGVFQWE